MLQRKHQAALRRLNPGDLVGLEVGREGARSTYQREVCGIDERSIVVAVPAAGGILSKGECLDVTIGERGDPVGFCRVPVIVMATTDSTVHLAWNPDSPKNSVARSFSKERQTVRVRCRVTGKLWNPREKEQGAREIVCENMSVGGLGATIKRHIAVGTHIELSLQLPSGEVALAGQITRCRRRRDHYFIGIQLEPMGVVVEREIFSFILDIQRILIRRGLL